MKVEGYEKGKTDRQKHSDRKEEATAINFIRTSAFRLTLSDFQLFE
jgi:hypothetical protein